MIDVNVHGPDHQDVATDLVNMAKLLQSLVRVKGLTCLVDIKTLVPLELSVPEYRVLHHPLVPSPLA